MVDVKGISGINMILPLLEDIIDDLRVRDNWLQPGGKSLCITLSLFLGPLGGG